jgi:hypothetical protein
MKKIGDLMKEMGFCATAPVDTQKAFLKYLGRVSQKSQAQLEELEPTEPDQWVEVQLSFNFEDRPKAG